MKRSPENSKMWSNIRERLYKAYPESMKTKNRQKSLLAVLKKEYKWLENLKNEDAEQFLKDVHYNERLIRDETKHLEKEKKKILAQQYLVNEGL